MASAIVDTFQDAGDHIAGRPAGWPNHEHCIVTNTLTITFNERMDTSIPATGLVRVNNGAVVSGATWLGDFTLSYDLAGLQDGQTHTLRVAATALDQAGTPGHRPLDGNRDGVGGDDFVAVSSVEG